MIIKGKAVSHGRYLKTYLISKRDNDIDPDVFRIRGTATPDNYNLSANEIILSGLLSRGDKNVYHGIINPSINDRPLTDEEWHKSIDKLLEGLGYEDQKHIAIRHIKDGREHMHLMVDRYSYELNKLLPDNHNYRVHQNVATELEEEFGHDLTPRKRDYKKLAHHKDILTDIWNNVADGRDFIEQAEALGYHVGKGLEKRPFKVVTPDGKSLDLVRQLKGVKTAEVFDRLRYEDLQTEAEALKRVGEEEKIAREMAEQEFLRNLEDEKFLAEREGREKEKKQIAELEAELARAKALEEEAVQKMIEAMKKGRERDSDRGYGY